MGGRPRELGDFKLRVTLRPKFRLKGYVSRYSYGTLNRAMVVYYNVVAESFHTKILCSRLHSIEVE